MFILCIQLVLVFLSALLNSFLLFSKDYFSNMKLSYDSYYIVFLLSVILL